MQLQDVQDFYPLTPLQQGLLFHSLSETESRMYFNQTFVTLKGDLDVEAFQAAWQEVIDRHPILRTFFVWDGVKTPVQVVKQKAVMPWDVRDWRDKSEAERAAAADALRREDLERGFDLAQPPLMRAYLLRTADDSHDLLWSFHHILMDGWSMFRVLQEIFTAFDARAGAGEGIQTSPPRAYRDYIAWLQKQSLAEAETFWRGNLAGFTAPTPLVDDGTSQPGEEDFATYPVYVSEETWGALQELAQKHRLTRNSLVQGAWALLLARTSGEDDVAFGTVVSGRPPELEGVEEMVGLFINTLPVRAKVDASRPVIEWMRDLQAEQAGQRDFEYSPLVEIQGWSEVPRGMDLFESIFLFENYQKGSSIEDMCRSVEIGDIRWFERHNYPIAALAIPEDARLMLRIIYMTARFSEDTVRRMLEQWRNLLDAIAANPECPVGELALLTPDEERGLIEGMNADARRDYERDASIHGLFAEQVRRGPDRVAVRYGDDELTYAELDRRANQLANHLRGLGVGPESRVCLCVERSLEMMVGILGILKAGGAYVSLDPDYPEDRLAFMLEENRSPVLLTLSHLAERLPTGDAKVLCLDTDWGAISGESATDPAVEVPADGLAYVIYTSGSTGRPKGTCVPHRAVVRLARNTNFADLTEDQVFLQFATISFDASTLELWGSLLNGARLVVFPAGKASLDDLARVIRDEGVTVLWLTAGLFHQLMDTDPGALAGVKQLLAGGDVLSVPHVKKALDTLEGCEVINGYGPTENTTFTACHRMRTSDDVGRTVPIGRPIANTWVYILDERLRPVPVGVAGDLYAGGDGVARGYLGHPALTAEKFLPDPFSERPGARMYAVGDQARWLPDGTIEFLGRNDFQVKIRGFRIELGEIENSLAEHPEVGDVCVLAREDEPGDKRLVAYVVSETDVATLREWLKDRLPEFMLPQAYVALDSFPLTANGKVDRRALPAPEADRREVAGDFAAPTAGLEQDIAAIWQGVLGLDRVGVHDNFFDLGGHSLKLIQVHGKLKKALGRDIPMVDMFQFPTVSSLAKHLGGANAQSPEESAATSEKREAGKGRLAKLQQRRRKR